MVDDFDSEHRAIAAGRGRWNPHDPTPKFGWERFRVIDRGKGNLTTCEMCESAQIRFEHHMRHPDGLTLVAGCVCSGHMTLSGHYADVEREELERALAEAREVDNDIRSAERKLRTREKALAKDAEELESIQRSMQGYSADALRTHVLRTWLPRLRKRAVKRQAEVEAVEDAYPEQTGVSYQHMQHAKRIEQVAADAHQLIEEVTRREQAEQLREFLEAPGWYRTLKGFRAVSPQGDIMQVYRTRTGRIKALIELAGAARPTMGTNFYPSFDAAQEKVVEALAAKLRRAGRL